MKEKYIEKLEEWFGDCDFEYETIKSTEDECIFVTISHDYGEKMISLCRVFKLGNGLEVSKDYEQSISGDGCSVLSSIAELLKVYEKVSK